MSRRSRAAADKISASFTELANALANGDKITEKFRCRKIILDLQPHAYGPEQVKATRNLLRVSQSIFAQFLGVKTNTVCAWEQGKNEPSDMACRFMDEIQRNPEHYRARLNESISIES